MPPGGAPGLAHLAVIPRAVIPKRRNGMMMGFGWPMMVVMLVGMLLGGIVLALLIWALVRGLVDAPPRSQVTSPPGSGVSSMSALDVLRERYASGEIDARTFDGIRRRL